MRQDKDGTIVLSRRNLLALLHKLDKPGSARTLIAPDRTFAVKAEDDDEHYKSREVPPGRMTSDTEEFIRRHEAQPEGM